MILPQFGLRVSIVERVQHELSLFIERTINKITSEDKFSYLIISKLWYRCDFLYLFMPEFIL